MTPENVKQLFKFSKDCSQNTIQTEGVAGLWNILHEEDKDKRPRNFAYLADEVGLGKTLQALAVLSLHLKQNPKAIAVVVVPKAVQPGWAGEWNLLMSKIYQPDGTLLFKDPQGRKLRTVEALICNNLHEFSKGLYVGSSRLYILRYSSFSRPVHFGNENPTNEQVIAKLESRIKLIGKQLTPDEIKKINNPKPGKNAISEANEIYVGVVSRLISELGKNSPIMTCFDEAQWLRNPINLQNTHIEKCFNQLGLKKLFLSATPWHTGANNIEKLSTYLEDYQQPMIPSSNLSEYKNKKGNALSSALRKGVKPWLIRRSRILKARKNVSLGKAQYRQLTESKVPLFDSPFYGMSMLLVQKNLVGLLNDKEQNRHGGIRSGELSCFESLKRSLGIKRKEENDKGEFDSSSDDRGANNTGPADANFLDALQTSYQTHMFAKTTTQKYLPHAKMDDVIKQLAELVWYSDVPEKVVVFVRRIDTVSEIALRLIKDEQQNAINLRLEDWLSFCNKPNSKFKIKNAPPKLDLFWKQKISKDELIEEESGKAEDETEELSLTNDFLRATRKKSGEQKQHGFMSSFRSRLLRKSDGKSKNPLGGMFLEPSSNNWIEWINVLEIDLSYPEEEQELIALMHLMALRNSDFLLELYVMQEYLAPIDKKESVMPLETMLINLFKMLNDWPSGSLIHLKNHLLRTRKMLKKSVEQWQDLKEKCFGIDSNGNICRKELMSIMQQLIPVARYSGAEKTANADAIFRLPFSPSIMVCTDKYKEGVNLHLNCDLMVHYGLPVSSGDLEQRIGRIDRFGSLYSRRLSKFAVSDECATKMPFMKINFPYLEGTLDERQVKHRMQQTKLAMRFHEGIVDERSLDQIEKEPLPTGTLSVITTDSDNLEPCFNRAKDEIELVRKDLESLQLEHSDKIVYRLENSDIWLCYETENTLKRTIIKRATLLSSIKDNNYSSIHEWHNIVKNCSVRQLDSETVNIIAFEMISAYTYRWQLSLNTPWSNLTENEYQLSRKQYVYLQFRGGTPHLMSPVTASYLINEKTSVSQWIISQNDIQQRIGRKRISIGYVENLNGFIWQTFVLNDKGIAKDDFFKLAFELANTSDLLQHVITLEDNEDLAWETPDFLMNWKE
ncbi:MAG: hypothetical protein HRT54_13035 [Colwellia sp.]|nr:hypothetical protein [Colwellia sp.]